MKHVQYLDEENYKTLIKEIKKDLINGKIFDIQDRKTQYCRDVSSSQLDL